MIVTLDPFKVTQIPLIKFLGPQILVEKFRGIVNENLENWEEKNNGVLSDLMWLIGNPLIFNLIFFCSIIVIGLKELPRRPIGKSNIDNLVNSGECNICFSEKLNEELPQVICANKFCNNYFHIECLYEVRIFY